MKTKNVIKKSAMIPTALIAGGSGFVGSYLCEALLQKGARVIVLDNFKTGKQSYVNHLLSNPNFALFDSDINNALPEEIQSVDYIFHLAGLEEYSYAKEVIDLNSLLTNAFGTKNLLDLARRSEAKFLLLSTIDVYEGRMSQLELSEYFGNNKIEENRYMLAEAKRYAEALVWEFYKKNQIDARIVRVPEIFGPRMNLISTGNLGRFVSDMMSGRDLTIFGEGNEKEFYLYIDDAITGVLKAMYNDKTKGNIFSLVPREPVTVLELAYMIKGVSETGISVKFEDAKDEGYFKPGLIKLPDTFNHQILKWEPKTNLKDGLLKSLSALNYATNTYGFKPARLIELKAKSQQQPPEPNLFSLQDVKGQPDPPETKVPTANVMPQPPLIHNVQDLIQADEKGANFVGNAGIGVSKPAFQLPKFKMPDIQLPFSMPHLNLPKPNLSGNAVNRILIFFALLIPAVMIFIGFPLTSTFLNARKAAESLNKAKLAAQVLDTEAVKNNAKQAYDSFYKAKSSMTHLRPLFVVVHKQGEYRSLDNLISSLVYFSKALYTGAKAAEPIENLWEVIRPDTFDHLNTPKFAEAKVNLENARNTLTLAQADFKYVNKEQLPQKYHSQLDQYAQALDMYNEAINIGLPIMSSLPDLLGDTKLRKYLILFQNSNEIRATGGFIGSYGVLTLEEGKIKDLVIDDIYNPDGQIDQRNIVAEVPGPIKEFLKEERMHIRNANWHPDFVTSAQTIEDLYFKVTGEKVDGVFAIDLYFIQNILRVTGPIYLSAYNEEISADNVYERAEFHSEFKYQDGSDQKRSFLTILGTKLLERLFSLQREQLGPLGASLATSLNQRHLLLSFANDPINNLLKTKGWDGALITTDGDYLYVVDSNLGGTKANYYVKKNMAYSVSSLTRDGLLRGILKIEYKHTGKDLAWPGGPYTNYLRILSQKGAKLTGASLAFDGKEPVDIFNNVNINDISNYTAFETSFVLQPQSTIVVTFNYDLSPTLTLSKDKNVYSLYWQKQPGTQDEDIDFLLSKPFGFNFGQVLGTSKVSGESLNTAEKLNEDMYLYVKLE